MKAERRQRFTVRPNGALWDEQTFRAFLGDMDRRAPQLAPFRRLSTTDPMCVAIEESLRGSRAAA